MLFDWGNTLVDYPLGTTSTQLEFLDGFLRHQLHRFDYTPVSLEEWRDVLIAINTERSDCQVTPFATRMRSWFPFIGREELIGMEEELCRSIFGSASVPQEVWPSVQCLLNQGYAVGIISNLPWGVSAIHWQTEFSHHLRELSMVPPIVCCGDVGFRKPHSAPFLRCLQLLGRTPQEAVMVGDSIESDIKGALQCGLAAVLIGHETTGPPPAGVRTVPGVAAFVEAFIAGDIRSCCERTSG
ncbi:HAD family hydrolase [Roseimicrobium sp. ORNL1]|uniref:HAD family hydrolase n=1 Tax=Roseimicrobium sp. ORNL1 TaxID=2711231 RepID=UPI0013E1FD20|nr:HAD family hydrolase [Roseimicrobium sp. ORNL1]QIF05020.1 HAD family hydrolase [Roseimicrobium sp. ORNL1]